MSGSNRRTFVGRRINSDGCKVVDKHSNEHYDIYFSGLFVVLFENVKHPSSGLDLGELTTNTND